VICELKWEEGGAVIEKGNGLVGRIKFPIFEKMTILMTHNKNQGFWGSYGWVDRAVSFILSLFH
jgi:hypothetical protein